MKVRVELELTDAEIVKLAGHARYLRENPRVAWKVKELRLVARQCVQQLVRCRLETLSLGEPNAGSSST